MKGRKKLSVIQGAHGQDTLDRGFLIHGARGEGQLGQQSVFKVVTANDTLATGTLGRGSLLRSLADKNILVWGPTVQDVRGSGYPEPELSFRGL